MKTLLEGIMYWCKKMFLSKEEVNDYLVQPDWNENDENSPAYVKNRMGGYFNENTLIIDEDIIPAWHGAMGGYWYSVSCDIDFTEKQYTVIVGDDSYVLQKDIEDNRYYFRNDISIEDARDAFPRMYRYERADNSSQWMVGFGWGFDTTDELHLTIVGPAITKIPTEYLNISSLVSEVSLINQVTDYLQQDISEVKQTATAGYNMGVNAMRKADPQGTGTFSLNRATGVTKGECSVAMGYNTTASGSRSCAIGSSTKATGECSYAEGWSTTAEGYNSHAEGAQTHAKGVCSHAEGDHTIAGANCQSVSGSYNIENNEHHGIDGMPKYYEIVGNGESTNKRSNARTLDYQGNAWFAGNVYVGSTSGTNQDEGSVKLVTETEVNDLIEAKLRELGVIE